MSIEVVSTSIKEVVMPAVASDNQSAVDEKSASVKDETLEESETSEENLDDNDSDSSVSEDDEEIKDELKEDQKPKKNNGFKKRIDKLSARATKAEQDAEYWRQVALNGAGKPQDQTKSETKQTEIDENAEPDSDDFESHKAYVKALTAWTVKQNAREEKAKETQAQAKAAHEEKMAEKQIQIDEYSKTKPDFDEVMKKVSGIHLSEHIREAILDSKHTPELMYELSKNPDELKRINSLSPIATAREIGIIEAHIKNSESPKKETKPITKAPPVISPIGGKSATISKSLNDMSYEEYKQARREQSKRT